MIVSVSPQSKYALIAALMAVAAIAAIA